MNHLVRIWVIFIAIILGFVLYVFAVRPIFKRMCIVDTNNCLWVGYQQYQNSVLVHTQPFGLWVWFDGEEVLVYGLPTGRQCEDAGFDPAYVIDVDKNIITGWSCARSIKQVQQFYNDKKCPIQYLFERKYKKTFDIYDLINLLSDNRIINLKPTQECSKDIDCGSGNLCQAGTCVVGFSPKTCKIETDCEQGDDCKNGICVSPTDCEKYAPSLKAPNQCSLNGGFLVYNDTSPTPVPPSTANITGSPFSNIGDINACMTKCSTDSTCVMWSYDSNTKTCYGWKSGVPTQLQSSKGETLGIYRSAPTASQGGTVCEINSDCTYPSVCKGNICTPEPSVSIQCDNVMVDCPRGMECQVVEGVKKCVVP